MLLASLVLLSILLPLLPTGYSFGSCGTFPEWHMWIRSPIREYGVETTEYVRLVSSYLEGEAPDMILIDVREPDELVESGQIPGTINIPLGDVENALSLEDVEFEKQYGASKPALDTDIVFSCRSGMRSLVALDKANKLGYSNARHYVRGYLGWQEHLEQSSNIP